MKARDIMTANPSCCTLDTSVADAAILMVQHDCGCIPVVEDESSNKLVGVVTDRDLAVRGFARGLGPDAVVRDVVTRDVSWCSPDSDLREVERIMSERLVRRVPVVDDSGRCMGMIAQADLARAAELRQVSEDEFAHVVERISEARIARTSDARASRITDERQDSIRQGIGAPEESPTGKAAEEKRREKAAKGPQIGGAMGGTSDAESAGDEAAMNRSLRDAERWRQ